MSKKTVITIISLLVLNLGLLVYLVVQQHHEAHHGVKMQGVGSLIVKVLRENINQPNRPIGLTLVQIDKNNDGKPDAWDRTNNQGSVEFGSIDGESWTMTITLPPSTPLPSR